MMAGSPPESKKKVEVDARLEQETPLAFGM